MRLGQTSVIYFFSRFGSSIIGFLSTVYIARVLGSETLGVYFLTLALVGWLKIANIMGIPMALTKRVSEAEAKHSHVSAGIILITAIFAVLSVCVFLARTQVNDYLGAPLYGVVILLFGMQTAYSFGGAVIQGEHLVHIHGMMGTAQTIIRTGLQILIVLLGFGIVGLIISEIVGFAVVILMTVAVLSKYYDRSVLISIPKKKHFMSVFHFAKYSWLDNIQGKSFNLMDKIVLGFFVSSGLVGIYSICWNLSAILMMFSKALRASLFPEMSKLSSDDAIEKVGSHLEDMLAFSGLLTLPGLVGTVVVGRDILNIYGSEFQQGYLVLILLAAASITHSYHLQFVNTVSAIDRPDISFKINIFFVMSNIILNVLLVYSYGWVGAAVATTLSSFLSTLLSYWFVRRLVPFSLPLREVSRQLLASALMGGTVFAFVRLFIQYGIDTEQIAPVLMLVGIGVIVYFTVLILISSRFRTVVSDNIPIRIPQLGI